MPSLSGIGLFSGRPSTLTIHPVPSGSGLAIRRANSADAPTPLTINFLSTNRAHTCFPPGIQGRNSTIAPSAGSPFAFATVEHAMSALAGLNITDALLELDGPELPILDGSSMPFVQLLSGVPDPVKRPAHRAGSAAFHAHDESSHHGASSTAPYILPHVVEVLDQKSGARIRAIPRDAPGTSYSYLLDYGPSSPFKPQAAEFDSARHNYVTEVAPARTFSLRREAEAMQKLGLFTHVTPREMLVLEDDGSPIDNTLRFDNEPARHKLLDLIGDLTLLGRPIQADIVAQRSGHALTHELVREILRRMV